MHIGIIGCGNMGKAFAQRLSQENKLFLYDAHLENADHLAGQGYGEACKKVDDLLKHAIGQLPEYQRMMVVLYHTQSKSYEEIADIMKLPIGTVKSRLNRARLALKEKLEPIKELFNI